MSSFLTILDNTYTQTASSPAEVMKIFAEGSARRKVASTQVRRDFNTCLVSPHTTHSDTFYSNVSFPSNRLRPTRLPVIR
jgi:hypothetical protein